MHNLENLLQQSSELPSLPEVYFKVSDLLESKTSDAYKIGEAVQTDPALTARILALVNSAYYGLPNHVTSIPQAVSLLGRKRLKQVLMGSVLAGVFSDEEIANFGVREFWEHSIKTAIIARHIAMQNAQILDHEAFFTAGLLHDIGRLVLAREAADELAAIDAIVNAGGKGVVELETERLGISHLDVGRALMKKWNMPSMLTQCVLKHHQIDHSGPFEVDTSIVYLANQLSQHELPVDEEAMETLLASIPNWEQTGCPLDQIYIACKLADEQGFEVMRSLGMVQAETIDDFF